MFHTQCDIKDKSDSRIFVLSYLYIDKMGVLFYAFVIEMTTIL